LSRGEVGQQEGIGKKRGTTSIVANRDKHDRGKEPMESHIGTGEPRKGHWETEVRWERRQKGKKIPWGPGSRFDGGKPGPGSCLQSGGGKKLGN